MKNSCYTCPYSYYLGLELWCGHPEYDRQIKRAVGCDRFIADDQKALPGKEPPEPIYREYQDD